MKKKVTKEEKKQLWDKIMEKITPQDQKEISKPIRDFIFNTIVDAPIMPDIKPIDEDELN